MNIILWLLLLGAYSNRDQGKPASGITSPAPAPIVLTPAQARVFMIARAVASVVCLAGGILLSVNAESIGLWWPHDANDVVYYTGGLAQTLRLAGSFLAMAGMITGLGLVIPSLLFGDDK